MNITEEMLDKAGFAAGQCFTDWTSRPNRDAYVGELTRQVARATLEAVAPLFAAQMRPPGFEVRVDGDGLVVACDRCHESRRWPGSASLLAVLEMADLHGCGT